MEDELDREGMDEEVSETKKAKGGSPLKMIIILGIMVIAAIYLVFFGPLKGLLGEKPPEREERQQQSDVVDTEYFSEYKLEEIIHTMLDERGKIKNVVIKATFMAEEKTLEELKKRTGLIEHIIISEIDKYNEDKFIKLLYQETKDSLSVRIVNRLNSYLPDKEKLIKKLFLTIITM